MDFTFVSRRPAPPLGRFAESVWYARGRIDYPSERIAPTGSTVAVVVLGSPILETPADGAGEPFLATTGFLIGPHDRPVVNAPTAETFCVGIVSTPIGCQALFGVAPAPLRGRVVDLATAWPPAATLRRGLARAPRLRPERMLDRVEAALLAGLGSGSDAVDRCEAAVRALEADPTRSIGDVAAAVGVSHGHLDREFMAVVGLSPRALSRILRLRMLLAGLDVYAPVAWTALATRFGWFDQSHFIRDFKRYTGVTPSRYVAAQRGVFTPAQAAPGFVPDVKSVQDDNAGPPLP
ncbi:helix-turn-helix domain-containing protein [Phytohabitans sp. ZYX-F-186]|uniref:Helix-turn-helix domain-containing protein n=1 Tax=Phytohabitans maris TaxID=3071409 RepID=A0ABU0ZN83_9ACTN|nr:helix-turn-helix domain-containing protein [Phytohabitans sp. ZYX-F-186]MDQ7908106.1 helix-turn-helix domain-containing protein [Phytohabitans sp. ZYX-F-186]